MKSNIKKGFTLVEIMIVISIIGILSVVLIPKVGAIKIEAKNNSVRTNVSLVRSYLENRAGKDGAAYYKAMSGISEPTQEQIVSALSSISENIKDDMTKRFPSSNPLINPFNNIDTINYSQGDVSSNNPSSASVVLGYSLEEPLPDKNSIIENSPSGTNFIGDTVVIIYSTGYVLYGVDDSGEIISNSVYIIKFPPIPDPVKSAIIHGSSSDPGGDGNNGGSITKNIGDVVSYIKSIAIPNIITGVPNNHIWDVIQDPLYSNLRNEFTPGESSKHIVNPYFTNIDEIGIDNNWIDPNVTYSIISNPQPDYSSVNTKYATRPGTVIVYVTNNPIGYVVYGVDQNGNNVGKTDINLSTEITEQMTQKLAENVSTVYNILINYIDDNISQSPYGNVENMAKLAYSQVQSLNINNAYIQNWNKKNNVNSGNFSSGYALIVGGNDGGASYSDYKGTVIVDTLSDGSGYDIYGVDYLGNKYANIRLVKQK